MKKASLSILLIFTLGLLTLSACGGGGGGSSSPQGPTSAVITMSTTTTSFIPATTTINSYDVTITLPSGVTVKTMPYSSETGTDVVTASGSATGALVSGLYTAATGTYPGTVRAIVIKVNPDNTGFDPGEFCKVSVDLGAGHSYTAASFSTPTLDDVSGFDTLVTSSVTTVLIGQLSLSATVAIH